MGLRGPSTGLRGPGIGLRGPGIQVLDSVASAECCECGCWKKGSMRT